MENVKKNYFYNVLYQLLTFLLPLLTTPFLSRVIGAEGIGTYSYHFSVARYFVMFALLGLNNYGNRTIAAIREERDKVNKTFSSIYYMQCITSLVVIVVYVLFLIMTRSNLMGWAMLVYVVSSMFDVNWLFFGLEQFKLTVIRNTIIKLLSVVCIFFFVRSAEDMYIYGLIMAVSFLASQLVIWPFVRQYASLVKVPWKSVVEHFKPNLVLFIPVIAVSLYKIMDKIMLGSMIDMTQVGYYENTESIITIPIALIQSLGTVMLPKMSNLMSKDAKEIQREVTTYLDNSLLFVMFLSTSMSCGIMAISREIVPLIFGNEFLPCIDLFYFLAPSCIFIGVANVVRTQFLIPAHKDKIYIASVFVGAITNVTLNALLIPKLYAIGAAIGTLVAEAAVCIYQMVMVRKQFHYRKPMLRALPMLLAGVMMLAILVNMNILTDSSLMLQVMVKVIIGVLIYFVTAGAIYSVQRLVFHK